MIASEILFIILICLFFSAFFSGYEIAYYSSDKLRIEIMRQKGAFAGRILSYFIKKRSKFLATILIGNNLALVVYGIFMAQLIEPWLVMIIPDQWDVQLVILILQTLISTLIVLITAEFLPKSLFMINPDTMVSLLAGPMWLMYILLFPIVLVVEYLSKFIIIYIFRYEYLEDKPVFGITDLNNYFKKTTLNKSDEDSAIDTRIFNNAIEFKEVKVRECMIPRTEIIAVDVEEGMEELNKVFLESGHSKIVIYKESIDNVIGYCHSLELFKKPKSIQQILTPIVIVPETMPAKELLVKFIDQRKSLALVVDEFGGTSGIVSVEDIMEEIFGEIQDEHDDDALEEQKISQDSYMLSARLEIDYLNEKYNWKLPEGDYDTLGGLIITVNENIPSVDETIQVNGFLFQIVGMQDNRIERVKLTLLPEEND